MSGSTSWQQRLFLLVEWLKGFRYIKFGLVGASGTVVNLAVLYTAHEYLFRAIEAPGSKPYASLALAIAVATVNNFSWNRLWTWADRLQLSHERSGRKSPASGVLLRQFGLYTLASWFGIALQYGLTLWLTNYLHYMLANVIAIVIASVSNYLANDRWTFRQGSPS
jgi:putative flippase GtrA